MDILGKYVLAAPTKQAVIDIFDGEWSSQLPVESGLVARPGLSQLFADPRIAWLSQRVGGFSGKRILELGPLEAGHTHMMHQGGAKEIVAIEGNIAAFLKCLCIKELFGLERAHFLLGEIEAHLCDTQDRFDLCVASGVLYHLKCPASFLQNVSRLSDTVFVWTHYFDPELVASLGEQATQFESATTFRVNDWEFEATKRHYASALDWAGFCGGPDTWSLWLTRPSLFALLEQCGYGNIECDFDDPHHPNGPAIALIARRR
jgi:uncharacterized protein DUF1698